MTGGAANAVWENYAPHARRYTGSNSKDLEYERRYFITSLALADLCRAGL